jgi:Crp-like helix-turn-helix domain
MIVNEGLVGTPVLLGADTSPLEAILQLPGSPCGCEQAHSGRWRAGAPLSRVCCFDLVQAFHVQVALTAACNGRHKLSERLARWLLTARDRVISDQLPLSHEFLSDMLCVRRAGVTVALGTLRAAGLVSNSNNRVTIIDRQGPEAASCECHRTVSSEYERLLR